MLFHKRLPRNFMESMPNVMLFLAGIGSRPLVLMSYLTSFLIKYSCIKGGLVLLSVLCISIIGIRRFWVRIFVSQFFASNASNVDSWSSSSILSARLCTLSMLSFAAFPQNSQIKVQCTGQRTIGELPLLKQIKSNRHQKSSRAASDVPQNLVNLRPWRRIYRIGPFYAGP